MHWRAQTASQCLQGSMRPQYTYITINIGYNSQNSIKMDICSSLSKFGAQQEMAGVSIHNPAEERHSPPVPVCYWFLLKGMRKRREGEMVWGEQAPVSLYSRLQPDSQLFFLFFLKKRGMTERKRRNWSQELKKRYFLSTDGKTPVKS